VDTKIPTIEELLPRIAAGDRNAMAEFVLRYQSRIRRRLRGKFAAIDRAGACDLDDVFSSVWRRVDEAFLEGRIAYLNCPKALEAFIFGTAMRVAREKARQEQRLRAIQLRAADALRERWTDDDRARGDLDLEPILSRLAPDERELFALYASGLSALEIASTLGVSVAGYRKRRARLLRNIVANIPLLPHSTSPQRRAA
jgi:RNA polymerase sigma factor (sigma-70 family)